MEGEQFSLCWNNFHNNLTAGFHSLLKDQDLVDVTLAADGKFLKAHRTVLSVCSPFFKELFRANPCDHPIVILPDVSYRALRSLLNFMYQGEVSVSQEEIPTFMRVAEMLKVKGLTDNSSSPSDTNGFPNANRNINFTDQRQNLMKRPRPIKKLIRPIQHLRPLESPKLEKPPPLQNRESHPIQPPIKRPHIENENSLVTSQIKHLEEPLIKPKEEPVDPTDEENTSHSGEDSHMDISQMLDTSLGEPSPSHPFPGWPAASDLAPTPSQDTSSPGLTLLKSARGQLVLIYNGHMYTLLDKKDTRMLWVCVKKKTLNCPGFITTISGPTLLTVTEHNHQQMHDVIKKLQVPSCSISPELNKL